MRENEKVANINTNLKNLFFHWMDITKPFHKLSNQKQRLVAMLLYYYHIYGKEISNDKLLWQTVFSADTKMLIKEELGLKDFTLQNTLTFLRNRRVIVNNKVVPNYIPNLSKDVKRFNILFSFNIVAEDNGK